MGSLRRTLLDGAMVVLPFGAAVLLVLAIVSKLRHATDPLAAEFGHPLLTASVLLVLLCLLVGIMVRSALGRLVRHTLESLLFERIPGYRLAKAFTGNGPLGQGSAPPQPALVVIEEGEAPALVMDRLADGRMLVFVPGSPAVMSGSLYIFAPERVTLLDIPLMSFLKAISSWGLGLPALLDQAGTGPPDARVR